MANAPKDPTDNIWPIKYVRDIIEKIGNNELYSSITCGTFNNIGVRVVDLNNPGKFYEDNAKKYKSWANNIRFSYPKTACLLNCLARSYFERAKIENNRLFI